MHGLYGTITLSPAAAHLRVPARLSGRIFEAAATVRPMELQQAALAKIAKVTARRALDQLVLVILSAAKRSRRISVHGLAGA